MHERSHPQLDWFRAWPWLYGLALVALGLILLAFGVLGEEARVDEPTDFDIFVHDWVIAHRAGWPVMTAVFRWATRFGNPEVATLATACIAFALAALHRRGWRTVGRSEAIVWLGVILGGRLLSILFKLVFQRDRPPLVNRLVAETTYSFPSGHSVFAAVFFTMLAALLARVLPASRPWLRLLAACLCLGLAGVIGVSRVWLGVHYPTDVAGGLLLGVGWVFAVWMIRIGWSHWHDRPVGNA